MMQSHTEFSIESRTVNAGMPEKGKVRGTAGASRGTPAGGQALPEVCYSSFARR